MYGDGRPVGCQKGAEKAVMDLGGYALYKPDPQPTIKVKKYADILLLDKTSEDIFVEYYLAKNRINNIARYNSPNGLY